MDLTALLLSRLQFAFTVSFHIIFPSFTNGVAARLTVIEALHLATERPAYRIAFDAIVFAAAFGTLAMSSWPCMIPFSITVEEAATRHSKPPFMLWGASLFVFPLILLYAAINYSVFGDKIRFAVDNERRA